MKLIAIYIDNYGLFQDQLLTFSSDFRVVKLKSGSQTILFKVENTQKLPDDFFSIHASVDKCVHSVSTIIGKNGAGKTSIARLFCNLPQPDNLPADSRIVLVVEIGGEIKAYIFNEKNNIRITYNGMTISCVRLGRDRLLSLLRRQKNLTGFPFKFVYYSPYFTTEQDDFVMSKHGDEVVNISTTWLMYHPEDNIPATLDDRVSPLRSYDSAEKIRVLEFCEKFRTWRYPRQKFSIVGKKTPSDNKKKTDAFNIPTPLAVSITPRQKRIFKVIEKEVLHAKSLSQEGRGLLLLTARKLDESLSCTDFFTRVFLAYAARYLLDSLMSSNAPMKLIETESYLRKLMKFLVANDWCSIANLLRRQPLQRRFTGLI